jgi:hypothetical protein
LKREKEDAGFLDAVRGRVMVELQEIIEGG